MQYEEAGPTNLENEQLLEIAREDYRNNLAPAFEQAFKRRGPGRDQAKYDFERNVCEALASVRKAGQTKLTWAKKKLLDRELNHPLWHRCERLHQSLAISLSKLTEYKCLLKELLDPKEFDVHVSRIEGKWRSLRMIQEHKQDLQDALDELKQKK